MQKQKIIAVVGPTASGKTALAIKLAQGIGGEIISADSMQIYKGMDIATAKPTKEERNAVVHHLIDFLPQDKSFSVADFVALAKEKIADMQSGNIIPVIVGGTGLYIDTLLENINLAEDKGDLEYRNELLQIAKEKGNGTLLQMLKDVDFELASKLHQNNLNRIIRGLEIYKTTGITMSEHIKNSRKEESPYSPIYFGINYDREVLYDRINRRVDCMLKDGLIDEAVDFYKNQSGRTASSAIGYKELKPYLDGEISLDEATENLKRATRNYAKRQITWFKRNEHINWLNVADYPTFDALADKALKMALDFLKD